LQQGSRDKPSQQPLEPPVQVIDLHVRGSFVPAPEASQHSSGQARQDLKGTDASKIHLTNQGAAIYGSDHAAHPEAAARRKAFFADSTESWMEPFAPGFPLLVFPLQPSHQAAGPEADPAPASQYEGSHGALPAGPKPAGGTVARPRRAAKRKAKGRRAPQRRRKRGSVPVPRAVEVPVQQPRNRRKDFTPCRG
jgi:hypothetical protein